MVFLAPVTLILCFNIMVMVLAVTTAFQSASFRKVKQGKKLVAALRNTMVLTILLGLSFLLGVFPLLCWEQEFLPVILSGSSGVFILLTRVLANDELKRKLKNVSD